jgi:hypothetical protein
MLVERGDQQPVSLAEAFFKGVDPRDEAALSRRALRHQRAANARMSLNGVPASFELDIHDEHSSTLADVISFACDWEG